VALNCIERFKNRKEHNKVSYYFFLRNENINDKLLHICYRYLFVFILERPITNDPSNRSEVGASNLNDGRLLIPDESTLSRLVAARLDLPISQSLLDRNFKLSIIKRCWEDQLRLKRRSAVILSVWESRVKYTFLFLL
jgi:hypothetical protein